MTEGGPEGRQQLADAIAAQERLRGVVGDAVIDLTVSALRGQLEAMAAPVSRRAQITIVFGDVSGFTAMSERLDPEQVADVMNSLWDELDLVVRAHGGRIDKHIGDAVMALWGSDGVREDDPERAVRAALELQAAITAFRGRHGMSLTMRIGVNTGTVLLGPVGSDATEFTAMGDAVNVASRLEHEAPVGGVLISHDTYRHVRGVFDVQPAGALTLKGKSAAVRAYVVERAKPRAFRVATRGVQGVETRTIGRDAELARLIAEFDAGRRDAGARLVTIVGEAGVGKSRLLYDFRNVIELHSEEVLLLTGRAQADREALALGLLRDVISTRFGILQGDDPATVGAKLRGGFSPLLTAAEAEVTGFWLGFQLGESDAVDRIAGSAELRTVAATHLFAWLAGFTADRPAMLLLEDAHWSDSETLDVVEELVERADLRLLVVVLARPTLFDHRPGWGVHARRVSQLDLAPLDRATCRRLVAEVLQRVADLPVAVVDLVAERADGNPFYVEELVEMLIDDRVLQVAGDVWSVDLTRLDESRIPATLDGVLQARLDSLPGEERKTLQRAAVVGRVFWDGAVAALANSDPQSPAAALDRARGRELVHRRRPSAFAGCDEYAFRHALLRDVAYNTVLLRERPQLHGRAARWIEETSGARAGEHLELIAGHLELAGDLEAAAERLWRAGTSADRAGRPGAAVLALQRAFTLWDRCGVEPSPEAYPVLVDALRRTGDFAAAENVVTRGEAAIPAGLAPAAALYYAASILAAISGRHEREGAMLDAARAAAPEDLGLRCLIEIGYAWWHLASGRRGDARKAGERGLAVAHLVGSDRLSADAEAILADVAADLGELEVALRHTERERTHAHASGDLHALANACGHVGVVHQLLGDDGAGQQHYTVAAGLYNEALALAQRLGARPSAVLTMVSLAQMDVRRGDDRMARERVRAALTEGVSLGAEMAIIFCLQVDADRRLTAGDLVGGLALLGRLRLQSGYGSTDETETLRIVSRVALTDDDKERLLAAGANLDLDAVIAEIIAEPD